MFCFCACNGITVSMLFYLHVTIFISTSQLVISNYMEFMYCTVNMKVQELCGFDLTWNSVCPFSLNHSQVANVYCWLEPDEKEDWGKCLLPIRSLQFTILHEWNFTGNNHDLLYTNFIVNAVKWNLMKLTTGTEGLLWLVVASQEVRRVWPQSRAWDQENLEGAL